MALSWSFRRQLLYYTVTAILVLILLLSLYLAFFNAQPTCFDGKKNGKETGIDCGGSCSLICPEQSRKPIVLWARAFKTPANTYTLAAYVQNPFPAARAQNVPYYFELRDNQGLLVLEREGTIDIPALQTVPIVEVNADVGERTISNVFVSFPTIPRWEKVGIANRSSVRIESFKHADDYSRVEAIVVNDSLEDLSDITVMAVLFDTKGVARAASKSFISEIPRKSSERVVFTWPGGVPGIVRAELTPVPSL